MKPDWVKVMPRGNVDEVEFASPVGRLFERSQGKVIDRQLGRPLKVIAGEMQDSHSKTVEDESPAIQFLKVYFDFAYYVLVCPFRMIWDCREQKYICYSNKLQKMLHYSVFFIMGVTYLLKLRTMWIETSAPTKQKSGEQTKSISQFFDLAVYFFDSFFMLVLFLHFEQNRKQVVRVFDELASYAGVEGAAYNSISSNTLSNSMLQFRQEKCVFKNRLISTIIMTICLMTVILKLLEIVDDHEWSWSLLMHHMLAQSKVTFVFPSMVEAVPAFFVFLNISSTLYEKILNDFGDILFTMCALLFRSLVNDFSYLMNNENLTINNVVFGYSSNSMKINGERPTVRFSFVNQVLGKYKTLKEAVLKLNNAMHVMIGAFIAGNLPFFATTVLEMFGTDTQNVFVRLRYINAACYFFPSLCMAANANKKVDEIKHWVSLEENYSEIESTRLSVFLHDLHFHSIGLSALGIMTVTWNSVGSIISIVLTYAVIKTQFKMQPQGSCAWSNSTGLN